VLALLTRGHTLVLALLLLAAATRGMGVASAAPSPLVVRRLPLAASDAAGRAAAASQNAVPAPRVRAVRTAAGWRLPSLRANDTRQSTPAVQLDRLEVHAGRVAVTLADAGPPRRFAATAIELAATATVGPDRQSLRLLSLTLVPRGLALTPVYARGEVTRDGDAVTVRDLGEDDVARLAVFLASDWSDFITGETIAVDGGFLRT